MLLARAPRHSIHSTNLPTWALGVPLKSILRMAGAYCCSHAIQAVSCDLGCRLRVCLPSEQPRTKAGRLQLDSNFAWAATTRRPLQPAILGALLPPSCGQLSPPTQLQLSCCEVQGGLPACRSWPG